MKTFSLSRIVQKIAFSTGVQAVSKIGQLILSALTIKIISNALNFDDLGIYGKIGEFALFFSVVGNLGIFANTVRSIADKPHDGNTFMNLLVLRIITLLPFFLLGLVIALNGAYFSSTTKEVTQISASHILSIIILFIAFLADGIRSVAEAALQAHYKIERAAIILLAGNILEYGLIVILLKQDLLPISESLQLPLIFAATCIASISMSITMLICVKPLLTWRFKLHWATLKNTFSKSLPFGLINICNNIYFRFAPQYFIAMILTDKQFGSFSMSFRLANVAALFSTLLMFSVFPGFRQYIDTNDWGKAQKVYKGAAKLLGVAALLLVVFGSLLGPFALEILTKKQLILPELWFILPMMLLLAGISYGYDLILITLFAFSQERWLLKREVIAVTLSGLIFLSSLFLKQTPWNIIIILAGAIIAESFVVIMGIYKIRKIFQEKTAKT